jgi:uncharacterized phiE125 gp8 family phage protein
MIYPYKEQSRVDVLPVSLAYTKEYLHIDAADSAHNTTVTRMIKAARDFFESATNNSLTEITYKTYRSSFSDLCFEIRKYPLISIVSVKYYDEDDVLQTVSNTDYFIQPMSGYDILAFKQAFVVPTLSSDVGWPIEIEFKAGYTATEDAIPEDIADGLLAHIAKMFENRGDAYEFTTSTAFSTVSRQFVPRTTKLAIIKYKIEEIGA